MCCSTRQRRSLRASEDTPPQWLPPRPSPTGGPRGARQAATGRGPATGRQPTAPSGSPLPRRKETRTTPTAAAAPRPLSRRPPPPRTAAASGRDGRHSSRRRTGHTRALAKDSPVSNTVTLSNCVLFDSTQSADRFPPSPHGGRICAPRLRVRVCVPAGGVL